MPLAVSANSARRRFLRGCAMLAPGLCALPLCALPFTARADSHKDHDAARQALLDGRVLPLRAVLDIVARDFPGEPVKIEFEREDGRYIYEIKLLQASGSLVKLEVDAASGAVLKLKGRNIERRSR